MNDINNAFKRFGILGLIENAIIHLLIKCGLNISVMELLVKPVRYAENKYKGKYKFLEVEDFERQKKLNPQWFSDGKIEEMVRACGDKNNKAIGIVKDNLIIAYGWVSLEKMGFDEVELLSQDGYLWDDYTHPTYRGQGLHGLINNARINYLCSSGKTRALTKVAHYNRASKNGYYKSGFTKMQTYITMKVGKFSFSSLKY